jgi:predicted Rossmann fold nucleotide-binding protein DprA/Smf involved in DNA uptake
MHINELCRACQIPVSGLLALLLQLEFAGQIKRLPGERFQKNRLTK